VFRAQTTLEDDDAIVGVQEEAPTTGFLPLMRRLRDLGVEIAAAAL
jgi:hypothetical protein